MKHADERLESRYRLQREGYDLDRLARRVAILMDMPVEEVFAAGKNRRTVRARSLVCFWAVRHCGMTMSSLAKKLGLSSMGISQSVKRGEKIADEDGYELF